MATVIEIGTKKENVTYTYEELLLHYISQMPDEERNMKMNACLIIADGPDGPQYSNLINSTHYGLIGLVEAVKVAMVDSLGMQEY